MLPKVQMKPLSIWQHVVVEWGVGKCTGSQLVGFPAVKLRLLHGFTCGTSGGFIFFN